MKKLLFILGLMLIFTTAGFAQDSEGQGDGGKIKAYQIAFLTQRLNLKPEEAQRFWPVFNQYQDELKSVRRDNKNLPQVELDQKVVDIRKKYFQEFSKVLNKDRADRVFKADNEFRDVIRKEIQERRQLKSERRGLRQ